MVFTSGKVQQMTNNEWFEYWFIRIVGSTDEFEFLSEDSHDDIEENGVFVTYSDYDDKFSSFSSDDQNQNVVCFNLFGFMF